MKRKGKHIYFFGKGKADGNRTMKDLLGGKGSGLAEMTNAGLPVPPGFTIATSVCTIYYKNIAQAAAGDRAGDADEPEEARGDQRAKLGASKNPLLVSVRSGAKFSMPGMMNTILNLGLNDKSVEGLKQRTGNGRFAYDSYRRFIQMFGTVVLESRKRDFEHAFEDVKKSQGREAGHRPRLSGASATWSRGTRRSSRRRREGLSAGPARAVARRARRGVPLLAEPARQGIPPHLRHSRPLRHRGQRAGDGVWQHGRRPAPASASRAIRRPARKSSTASSWSTPRAKTWSPASARRSRSPS